MAAHKNPRSTARNAVPAATGKENVPTRKTKPTVSVASLFGQKHELKRKAEEDESDVLAFKAKGVSKQYRSYRPSKKAEESPIFQKFLGTPLVRKSSLDELTRV